MGDDYHFTADDLDELYRHFPEIQETSNIAGRDVKQALDVLGVSLAGHEFRELVGNLPQHVSLQQLTEIYARAKDFKDNTKLIQKSLLLKAVADIEDFKVDSTSDVKHSVSKSEEQGFTLWINKRLGADPDLADILPINVNQDGMLYERCMNGVLLCKMVNVATPNTIDERSINKGAALKNLFNIHENLTLAINSAAAIGCCVVNMGPEDIQKKRRHIVLGLIWQVIRKGLVDTITLTQHSELICLLQDGETPEDLLRLKPEELLMRWVNYHLARAGCNRRMTNYNSDLADSEIYAYLLDQIAPMEKRGKMKTPGEILGTPNMHERAVNIMSNTDALNARMFLSPEDICNANDSLDRLHLAFIANLFNMYPSLDANTDLTIQGETLEEKMYRNWMNSLGVRPFVSFLTTDLTNGLVLLQLIDVIQPGTVDWSKVVQKFDPKKRLFQEQGNCNMVISSAKSINIRFVNVSGEDIREGHRKLILGVCFTLMNVYTYKLLYEASGNLMPRDDKEVLQWANEQLAEANAKPLSSFRDPSFATGVPILQILEQIKPGSTNQKVWLQGGSDDLSLCTYAVSCCRKAGARIYTLPEHIHGLDGKMIQTTLVCLQALHFTIKKRAELDRSKRRSSKLNWLHVEDPDKKPSQ